MKASGLFQNNADWFEGGNDADQDPVYRENLTYTRKAQFHFQVICVNEK